MQSLKKISFLLIAVIIAFAVSFNAGCRVEYRLRDVSISDSIKTFRLQFIENRASYINPQLSPSLTEGIRRKMINQTRLSQTTSDNAHLDISGTITEYIVTTSGIANKQEVSNRLTVTLHIVVNNQLTNEPQEFDVSRGFEFSAQKSQQAAEAELLEDIVRSLSDDFFNRLFSNW